jgi:hypothetical protein
MAIQFWKDMSILEGGLELAGHGKSVDMNGECTPLDTTALSTTGWVEVAPGLKTGTVSLEFMQDFANGSVDNTLWDNFGSSDVVRSIATASADGSAAYLMRGISLQYTPLTGNVGELAMGSIQSTVSTGPLVRGLLIHPSNVSRTSSSTGTGRQIGAVASGQTMYAALHVISVSGTSPTLDVIVQSDDNSGFTSATNRITFSQASAIGAEWGSVAGAVTDDYWRISYTIGGSATPTFAFAVTAGIV